MLSATNPALVRGWKESTISRGRPVWCCGFDGVIPLAVEFGGFELCRDGGHLVVADLDSFGVAVGVGLGVDGESGAGGGGADQFDHDLVAGQGSSSPVAGDRGEQSVLDFVPLGGAGRVVADGDGHVDVAGELGKFDSPEPDPVAVGPAGVGVDQ